MNARNIIIFYDFAFVSGGAGKVAFDAATGLADAGYNVTFFSGTGPESPLLRQHGIRSVCLGQPDMLSDGNKLRAALRSIWNGKAYKATMPLLEEYSPDDTLAIVHGYSKTLSPAILSAIDKLGFKCLLFLHDYFAACPNGGFYDYQKQANCHYAPLSARCWTCNCDLRSFPQHIYRCIRQLFVRRSLKRSRNIHAYNVSALSGSLMRPYIAGWFKAYETLPNPVDVNQGEYIDIRSNDKYLFIGRLSEEKGIRHFCKVTTELSLKGIVLGDGYLMEELKAGYPNVDFVGWASGEDKAKFIRQAKCLVFPSIVHETFGLTVAELLSFGIPIIMPTGCGASYLVKDGVNGFLYPMGDYEGLKAAVTKFERVDMEDFMASTRAGFDREQFTRETYINNLQAIFDKL